MHIQGIRYKNNFKGAKLAGQLLTLYELLQHMGLEFCLNLLTIFDNFTYYIYVEELRKKITGFELCHQTK